MEIGVIHNIQGLVKGQVLVNEPLSKHTSFHIGGPADVLVVPTCREDVAGVLAFTKEQQQPLTVLGNGTNVLVRDKGIRGVVLKLGNALKYAEAEGERLTFGSGYSLAAASKLAGDKGLTGMEFAVGIPGSIGGAVYMNAGAYDGEMKNVVESVSVITKAGEYKVLSNADLEFAYRNTSLHNSGDLVLEVVVKLTKGDPAAIKEKMADFSGRRITKQPLEYPSAGSTFKRPPGYFAGTLIDQAGLKGFTVGGAQVSSKHAGFVINVGNATAADVLQLIKEVQDKIYELNGVRLQPEVLILGEE